MQLAQLHAAITASYDAVNRYQWDGMIYTHLYGRLELYRQASKVVEAFLEKIKHCAPRPFLLPQAGLFPAVSSSLQEKIKCDGELVAMRKIGDCVHIVSGDYCSFLILQVNDLSSGSM